MFFLLLNGAFTVIQVLFFLDLATICIATGDPKSCQQYGATKFSRDDAKCLHDAMLQQNPI